MLDNLNIREIITVEQIALGISQHTYKFYKKNGFILKEIRKYYRAKDLIFRIA